MRAPTRQLDASGRRWVRRRSPTAGTVADLREGSPATRTLAWRGAAAKGAVQIEVLRGALDELVELRWP